MKDESDRYKLLGSVRLYNVLMFPVLVIFILPFQSFTAIIFVLALFFHVLYSFFFSFYS